jgi:hypothetical protein
VEPKKWSGSGTGAGAIAWLFGLAAILSFFWAEIEWQSRAGDSIGIGTSGYALVLYARAIALAAIGTVFAVLSAGVTMIENLRLFHRSIHSVAESPSPDQVRR